jgi:hypothetical protein
MKIPILVICENNDCRADAVSFCDRLVQRFWSKCEFDMQWLSFGDLDDQSAWQTAVNQAASASMLIFSMRPGCEIPREVQAWGEAWVARRGEAEGSIIAPGDPGHIAAGGVSQNFVYLRGLAHRAGLDYLTELPEKIGETIPDAIESYSQRAHQKTSVLDQILQRRSSPPAFGA